MLSRVAAAHSMRTNHSKIDRSITWITWMHLSTFGKCNWTRFESITQGSGTLPNTISSCKMSAKTTIFRSRRKIKAIQCQALSVQIIQTPRTRSKSSKRKWEYPILLSANSKNLENLMVLIRIRLTSRLNRSKTIMQCLKLENLQANREASSFSHMTASLSLRPCSKKNWISWWKIYPSILNISSKILILWLLVSMEYSKLKWKESYQWIFF